MASRHKETEICLRWDEITDDKHDGWLLNKKKLMIIHRRKIFCGIFFLCCYSHCLSLARLVRVTDGAWLQNNNNKNGMPLFVKINIRSFHFLEKEQKKIVFIFIFTPCTGMIHIKWNESSYNVICAKLCAIIKSSLFSLLTFVWFSLACINVDFVYNLVNDISFSLFVQRRKRTHIRKQKQK